MKNIFLLLFAIFVVNVSFAQQKPKTEPTEMSIPYDVAQKMLLDLNDYDRLKELSKLDKEEIKQLNNKILFLEKTINTWEQKDTLNKEIISNVEQKFKIVNDQNDELRKELARFIAKQQSLEKVKSVGRSALVGGSTVGTALTPLAVAKPALGLNKKK